MKRLADTLMRFRRTGLGALTLVAALAVGLALPDAREIDAAQYTVQVGNGRGGIAVNLFMPNVIMVGQGDTVQFVNPYDEVHTVGFLAGTPGPADFGTVVGPPNPSYDGRSPIHSGRIPKGQSYTVTFPVAGRYEFQCLVHRLQIGVVDVVPPGFPVPSQAALEPESTKLFNDAVAVGEAARAAVPPPGKTANADGSSTWSIPSSPTAPIKNGSIDVMAFLPARLSVGVGDTVVWNNQTPTPHTVTFGQPRDPTELVKPSQFYDGTGYYNSGFMGVVPAWKGGTQFSLTFTSAGSYPYICILHVSQGMAGVIEVGPPGSGGGSVRPPATGDAGLVSGGSGTNELVFLWLPLLMLISAGSLAGVLALRPVTARRRSSREP